MAGIMFAMKKVLQMGSNRCHPSVIEKRINAVILGQSAPIFCYPKHFPSIFRLRVHPLFSKTIQCSMPRGKLIQSSNKESCSDIVQLIVGQWTPIPLLPPHTTFDCSVRRAFVVSEERWCSHGNIQGCEVAAPGYIKAQHHYQHRGGGSLKSNPEIIHGERRE